MNKTAYIETYFRIESGYDCGCMSKEKTEAFFAEIKKMFSQNGFTIEECQYNGCPYVVVDKTRLYCHPQNLSGPVKKELIERIGKILKQGTTFQYLRTDTYDEILDLTEAEELAYYHEKHDITIEDLFRESFRTKRSNLYKSREQVLETIAGKLRIRTFRKKGFSTNAGPVGRYIREIYERMVTTGELVEGNKHTDSGNLPLCRTATAKELKAIKAKMNRLDYTLPNGQTIELFSEMRTVNYDFGDFDETIEELVGAYRKAKDKETKKSLEHEIGDQCDAFADFLGIQYEEIQGTRLNELSQSIKHVLLDR